MQEAIETIILRLRELSTRILFNEWDERPTFGTGLDDETIERLQAALPSSLPQDVVSFLVECGYLSAASVHNGYFVGGARCFEPIPSDSPLPPSYALSGSVVRLTQAGSDGGGNVFLMGFGSSNPVWKWQHETGDLVLIASSFSEFLSIVASDWERYAAGDIAHDFLAG